VSRAGRESFYVLRFLLGIAEAGFFPGVILYLTDWFPARQRARTVALFMTAIPVASVIGSPVSSLLLGLDGLLGLEGWRLLFLIEGAPAVLLAYVVLRRLPDGPADAKWLTREQRLWLLDAIAAERRQDADRSVMTVRQTLTNGVVLRLALIYFGIASANYGVLFWLPQIVDAFPGTSAVGVGFIGAIPPAFAAIGMVLYGRHSDRTNERRWHVAAAALTAGAGLALVGLVNAPAISIAILAVTATGVYCALSCFWTIPTALLSGTAAAAGIGLINSIGNLGGFVGPYGMGVVFDLTGSYAVGLACLGALVAGAGVLTLRVTRRVSLGHRSEVPSADGPAAGHGARPTALDEPALGRAT